MHAFSFYQEDVGGVKLSKSFLLAIMALNTILKMAMVHSLVHI